MRPLGAQARNEGGCFIKAKGAGCDSVNHAPPRESMTKPAPVQPIPLACAGEDIATEMARWLTHLRAERRLSPKTLEAYARDLRQCLDFLSGHFGAPVTLPRFAALQATDIRAFMAARRAENIGGRSLMRGLGGPGSVGPVLVRAGQGHGRG